MARNKHSLSSFLSLSLAVPSVYTLNPKGTDGVVGSCWLSPTIRLSLSKLLVFPPLRRLLPGRAALARAQGISHMETPSSDTATFAPRGGGICCLRTAQLSGTLPDPAGPNPHPGTQNTDLPAAARGRSSTADPRLWRWSPAAARSATSGAACALLCVDCSSQLCPHSAGEPGRRHSRRLECWDARPRGTRCARQAPCQAASALRQSPLPFPAVSSLSPSLSPGLLPTP